MKSKTIAQALLGLTLVAAAHAQEPRYRVLVSLKDGGEKDATLRMASIDAGQRRVARLLDGRAGRMVTAFVSIPAFTAEVTREGWEALAADPDVARVDYDEPARLATTSPGGTIRSVEVQTLGFTGKGVTVAVIDSGVDGSHPDLAGALVDEACFCVNAEGKPCCPGGGNREVGPGTAQDANGHGTHVAGIIAGRGVLAPRGVAPDANVIAIRVVDANGTTTTSSMLAALDWLITAHPEVRIVNMSLGTLTTYAGTCDAASSITSSFASAGRVLRNRGTLIVASSGNDAQVDRMMAPACVSTMFSVGAVYSEDGGSMTYASCADLAAASDQVTCFSNSSAALSILSPGAAILSAFPGQGLAVGSGTSQAAAVVAGAAALLIEGVGGCPGPRLETAIRAAGVSIKDLRNGRITPRIDVAAALATLKNN